VPAATHTGRLLARPEALVGLTIGPDLASGTDLPAREALGVRAVSLVSLLLGLGGHGTSPLVAGQGSRRSGTSGGADHECRCGDRRDLGA
jgi:hypothetical protein